MARPTDALIVDDEAHVRTFLRLMLAEAGIDACEEAADGDAALAQIQRKSPGLVLLDINMPGMGGVAVLEKIAAIDPAIPVVIITAHSSLAVVKDAMQLGAVGYVLKHTPRAEMLETLRDVIEGLAEDGAD